MSNATVSALSLAATIAIYYTAKFLYARQKHVLLTPIIATPILLLLGINLTAIPYARYNADAHWLTWLLGPATIAFALPIYEYRALLRRHWMSILAGVVAATVTSTCTSIWLASLFGLSPDLRKALAVRSITTPFAVETVHLLGGSSELAMMLVVVTGVLGMVVGSLVLRCLPTVRSQMAHGALYGGAAHGGGTAKAHELGRTQGTVASLVMLIAGATSVLAAPLIKIVFF